MLAGRTLARQFHASVRRRGMMVMIASLEDRSKKGHSMCPFRLRSARVAFLPQGTRLAQRRNYDNIHRRLAHRDFRFAAAARHFLTKVFPFRPHLSQEILISVAM